MLSAAKGALFWLEKAAQEDWVEDLPQGDPFYNLPWRTRLDGDGEIQDVDLHVELSYCGPGGSTCGAAVVLAVMQLMRGQCLRGKVAAAGTVTPAGYFLPSDPPPPVTSTIVTAFLYPEVGGHATEEPQVPPHVTLQGFTNIREMVKYAFTI
jgi:hypothetical protein